MTSFIFTYTQPTGISPFICPNHAKKMFYGESKTVRLVTTTSVVMRTERKRFVQ